MANNGHDSGMLNDTLWLIIEHAVIVPGINGPLLDGGVFVPFGTREKPNFTRPEKASLMRHLCDFENPQPLVSQDLSGNLVPGYFIPELDNPGISKRIQKLKPISPDEAKAQAAITTRQQLVRIFDQPVPKIDVEKNVPDQSMLAKHVLPKASLDVHL